MNVTMICMVMISAIFLMGSFNGWFGMPGTIVMIFGVLCCVGISSPNNVGIVIGAIYQKRRLGIGINGCLANGHWGLASYGITLIKNQALYQWQALWQHRQL
jgi:DHA1 family bicyclomycin/chloramphenicol resistance-like MFS transporter